MNENSPPDVFDGKVIGLMERNEILEGGQLKGGVFRSHVQWIRDHRSPEELELFWKQLDPEISSELSTTILSTSWYPFAWLIQIDRSIARLFADGDENELFRELGRYSARINVSTTYRIFDRDTNHEFFGNSAILHKQFQDFGSSRYERTGETSGKMIYADYPCFSPVYCESAFGYFEACLLSHKAVEASVRETECQCRNSPTCTFELSWTLLG